MEKQAAMDMPEALLSLGDMLSGGLTHTFDYPRAFECYIKAARMGNAQAYLRLAALPLDTAETEKERAPLERALFAKAAEKGNEIAKLRLSYYEALDRGADPSGIFAPDDPRRFSVRNLKNGILTIGKEEYIEFLLLNGKRIYDWQRMSAEQPLEVAGLEVVPLWLSGGGEACPGYYRFLTMYQPSAAQLSPEFGGCGSGENPARIEGETVVWEIDYPSGKKVYTQEKGQAYQSTGNKRRPVGE